jgi:aspartokinase
MENKYRKYKQKYISSQMNKFGGGEKSVADEQPSELPPGASEELEAIKLKIEKINEELNKVLSNTETKKMTPEGLESFQSRLIEIQKRHSDVLRQFGERLEYWLLQTISNEEGMSIEDFNEKLIKRKELQERKKLQELQELQGLEEHKEDV